LDLSGADSAAATASALTSNLRGGDVTISPRFDEKSESFVLVVRKMQHGNLRISYVDRDFVESGDYAQIRKTAKMLENLLGPGAFVERGDQRQAVADFRQAVEWLLDQARSGLTVQRYKGLGEMNPTQLWETTMDPKSRRLLRAQIEDAIAADEIFTTLMGDVVEPRRAFIEANALGVRNLDV
jgi:DNA gyrase subunit B